MAPLPETDETLSQAQVGRELGAEDPVQHSGGCEEPER